MVQSSLVILSTNHAAYFFLKSFRELFTEKSKYIIPRIQTVRKADNLPLVNRQKRKNKT